MLNTIENGEAGENGVAGGCPLVIAHGLFGSARNWGVVSKRLAQDRRVVTVDMRNHGASPWFGSQTYFDMADDLAGVIAKIGGRADVLGHSMGGKAAMVLALTHPDLVRRLIVVDIAPVAYGHSQNHLIDAMQSLDLTGLTTRHAADEALSPGVPDPALRAFLLQSLKIRAAPPQWGLNLPVLRRFMPDIVGFPALSGQFTGPTLFLSGGLSDYIQPKDHAGILALFPNAKFSAVAGTGHWIHAEKPRELQSEVTKFLNHA